MSYFYNLKVGGYAQRYRIYFNARSEISYIRIRLRESKKRDSTIFILL